MPEVFLGSLLMEGDDGMRKFALFCLAHGLVLPQLLVLRAKFVFDLGELFRRWFADSEVHACGLIHALELTSLYRAVNRPYKITTGDTYPFQSFSFNSFRVKNFCSLFS